MYEFALKNRMTDEIRKLIGRNLYLQMIAEGLDETEWTLIATKTIDDDWFAYL